MRTKLRGGISGFGNVAALGHLPGWRSRTDVEIVAVHDPVAARRHEALRLIEGVRVYEELELMLSGERLDFVDVTSPPARHMAAASAALEAGAHVIVEKPLALTIQDFDRVATLAAERKRALFCVHNWKFAPAYQLAAQLAAQGRLGKLRYLGFSRLRPQPAGDGHWRLEPASGGGILIDHGWHVFYLMQTLAGGIEPESISARLVFDGDPGVEVTADLSVALGSGAQGYAHLSWRAPARRTGAVVYGDKAMVEIDGGRLVMTERSGARHDLGMADDPDDSYHSGWFKAVATEFEQAMHDEAQLARQTGNLADARTALMLVLRAKESHNRGGAPVPAGPPAKD